MKHRIGKLLIHMNDPAVQKDYNNVEIDKKKTVDAKGLALSEIHIEASIRYMVMSNQVMGCVISRNLFHIYVDKQALDESIRAADKNFDIVITKENIISPTSVN